jgi:hypothetical protein
MNVYTHKNIWPNLQNQQIWVHGLKAPKIYTWFSGKAPICSRMVLFYIHAMYVRGESPEVRMRLFQQSKLEVSQVYYSGRYDGFQKLLQVLVCPVMVTRQLHSWGPHASVTGQWQSAQPNQFWDKKRHSDALEKNIAWEPILGTPVWWSCIIIGMNRQPWWTLSFKFYCIINLYNI